MTLPSGWSELHRSRYRGVRESCGNSCDPGVLDIPGHHDWSKRETTADQLRIERYVGGFDLREKRLLHLGVGSSKLARRFCSRAKEIVGTTIEPNEANLPWIDDIPNYTLVQQNKYAADPALTPGQFDFIIDNNPASYCCCMVHLIALFEFYKAKLAPGGQVVTDRHGLDWVAPDVNPIFRMDFEDLGRIAPIVGFSASKIGRNTYVLVQSLAADKPDPVRKRTSELQWARSAALRKALFRVLNPLNREGSDVT